MKSDFKEKQYDVGVIIGRFQVPELHAGHKKLIETVISKHKRVLILLGVAQTLGTRDNPLDFTSRVGLFSEYTKSNPNMIIQPVLDVPCDKIWSSNIDRIIQTNFPISTVCLYGGRDSFIKCYNGAFDTYELPIIQNAEGTSLRKETGKVVIDTPDFRAGQIYQSQNQYPKLFSTVDIAVTRRQGKKFSVLMGKKAGYRGFTFPGGFVSPSDNSYEDAALRELFEEIKIEISALRYVGSFKINDWRYKGDEKILTTFFQAEHLYGAATIVSEFDEVCWLPVDAKPLEAHVDDSHEPLFENLMTFMKER